MLSKGYCSRCVCVCNIYQRKHEKKRETKARRSAKRETKREAQSAKRSAKRKARNEVRSAKRNAKRKLDEVRSAKRKAKTKREKAPKSAKRNAKRKARNVALLGFRTYTIVQLSSRFSFAARLEFASIYALNTRKNGNKESSHALLQNFCKFVVTYPSGPRACSRFAEGELAIV